MFRYTSAMRKKHLSGSFADICLWLTIPVPIGPSEQRQAILRLWKCNGEMSDK
jgi:hypothetical protein